MMPCYRSPFLQFVKDDSILVALYIVEGICLIFGIVLFVRCIMWIELTALRLMFSKQSVRTYIFILGTSMFHHRNIKSQVLYSFVVFFHSLCVTVQIHGICDRRVLLSFNAIYLVLICMSF